MADLKELATKRTTLLHFDPRELKIEEGLNARDLDSPEVQAHIQWLAESIAENGVKKPLEIFSRGDDVYVADGHCRLLAVRLLIQNGIEVLTVPCVPESKGNEVDRILNQNLANSGLRLTPLEEGVNIKRAVALGWTVSQVAKKLGRSVSWVGQLLEFQAASPEVHNMVRAGEVSATLAAQVARDEGAAAPQVLKDAQKAAVARGSKKVTAKDLPPRETKAKPTVRETIVAFTFKGARVTYPSSVETAVTIKDVILMGRNKEWADFCWSLLDVVDPQPPKMKPPSEDGLDGLEDL